VQPKYHYQITFVYNKWLIIEDEFNNQTLKLISKKITLTPFNIMTDISITLAKTQKEDLHTLFQFQTDKEGIYLAAFTPKDPFDKNAYLEKYSKLLDDPAINMYTIKR
jgi:hypothetical protein